MPFSRDHITRRTVLKAGAVIGATSSAGFIDPGGESDSDRIPPTRKGLSEDGTSHRFRVETVVDGLSHPWSIVFFPHKRRLLVSERDGRLHLVDRNHDTRQEIDGTPDVSVAGQGGLLDVALHPNFQSAPWVYLTYSAANENGSDRSFLPSIDLRTPMDVLYELATSLVDDPARFGDPDDVLCWGFSLPPDLDLDDPEAIVDHRRAALAALSDEWPWLQAILPLIEAACESPKPDPTSDPVVMGPPVSQQPLPQTAGG